MNLLADGAGLDGGHVFRLVNDVLIHYWPPGLHSWIHGTKTEEKKNCCLPFNGAGVNFIYSLLAQNSYWGVIPASLAINRHRSRCILLHTHNDDIGGLS